VCVRKSERKSVCVGESVRKIDVHMHTRTHAHARTYAHKHVYNRTRKHTHTHAYQHTRKHTLNKKLARTHSLSIFLSNMHSAAGSSGGRSTGNGGGKEARGARCCGRYFSRGE